MDVASLGANLATGNYLDAAIDAGGLIYDGVATLVPGLPAGAGALIKTSRAGRAAIKVANKAENLIKVGNRAFRSVAKADKYKAILNSKAFKGSAKLADAFWDAGKGGANKLAKALGTTGTGNAAHHIIPTTILENNKNVQKAVEEGFDFNGLVNGVGLDKTRHAGGHGEYTKAVNKMIDDAFSLKSNKGRKASDVMTDIANQIKSDIKSSKGNINDLYKKK